MRPAEAEDWTAGELLEAVRGAQDRDRALCQALSLIAYRQAGLLADLFSGRRPGEVYEVFPFWGEEEVRALQVEKYRRIMLRHAAQEVRGHG